MESRETTHVGDRWTLVYDDYVPAEEGLREALCALGNGYFVTRGAAAECSADSVHYPGTYLAGGYDRLVSDVAGRAVENEDLVNLPNWLPLTFRIDGGPPLRLEEVQILAYRQALDLRRGILTRTVIFRDTAGRETELAERRFVSMADRNLAVLERTLTARDWSGPVVFSSAIDGTVVNAGVPRYLDLAADHLEPVSWSRPEPDTVCLVVETSQSRIRIAQAARTRVKVDGREVPVAAELVERSGYVGLALPVTVQRGVPLTVEKTVALCSSRESGISEPSYAALVKLKDARATETLLADHVEAWETLWRRCAVDTGDENSVGMLLHLHAFHVLQTASPHSIGLDAGLPARGLHGEAYRGHVFWDELYVFPLLNGIFPEITKALLMYRYRRLKAAERGARDEGFSGAMFPWQSGSDGREETQVVHLNPKSGRWLPDNSRIQRHVNVAVAYNVWSYYDTTGDEAFLRDVGAEMLVQIARFLASLASFDDGRQRYVIRGVMGPDEYHDAYPWSDAPGIDDNAYTNVMTSWVLQRAREALDRLSALRREELGRQLRLAEPELNLWEDIGRRLHVPFLADGVIAQFEGYDRLEEFDWEGYRAKYGDIARLDRILEAEGDTPNRYRLSKQADALMLFYLFPRREVQRLLARLGYSVDDAALSRTIDFYAARTSHGSTLSRVVHAWLLARADPEASWSLFLEALTSDLRDIQGGTTREGVHIGVMAGTVDLVRRGYLGLELVGGCVSLDPRLPSQLPTLAFSLLVRDRWLDVAVRDGRVTVTSRAGNDGDVTVDLRGSRVVLDPGGSVEALL